MVSTFNSSIPIKTEIHTFYTPCIYIIQKFCGSRIEYHDFAIDFKLSNTLNTAIYHVINTMIYVLFSIETSVQKVIEKTQLENLTQFKAGNALIYKH